MWDELTLIIHFVTYSTDASGPKKPKFMDASSGTMKEELVVASVYFQTDNDDIFCIKT